MKKVLVTDDSEFIRKVIKDILSPQYDVVTANNGKKAVAMFKKEKPDMVLLDIIMPDGEEEGLIALKKLKALDGNVPVIMISAVGQDTVQEECKKLGAADYITKPFSEEDVLEKVGKYLK
jgi:two-component system, chemotaxis family, chemotaxis protein CheY